MEKLICSNCEEEIDPEKDEYVEMDDGTILCQYCYDDLPECAICGQKTKEEDLESFGDCRICPACMEEQCPTFNEADNNAETQAAYDAMRVKYIGKRVPGQKAGNVYLDTTVGDEAPITYSFTVTFDENGIITNVSRLSAEMLVSEWERGHDSRPYPISNDDYTWVIDDLMDENFFDNIDEEDDDDYDDSDKD